jgi:hypothetical protein
VGSIVRSVLTPADVKRRLAAIDMSQREFSRRTLIAQPKVSLYCNRGPVTVRVHVALLKLEMEHAIRILRNTDADIRCKRALDAILLIASEPLSLTPPPKRKRRKSESGKPNRWRLIPKLPPSTVTLDDIAPLPLWKQIAKQMQSPNHDAVQKALLLRRPNPPRIGPDDEPPLPGRIRTSDPI